MFVKGCQHTEFTLSTCPLRVVRHFAVARSQSLVEWSRLQLARKSPVSWKATPQTAWVCSVKVSVHLEARGERVRIQDEMSGFVRQARAE